MERFSSIYKFRVICFVYVFASTPYIFGQKNELDTVQEIGSSINDFALKMLVETVEQAGDSLNVALSPYTMWSLMAVIAEGARGNTAQQLESVLKIPSSNKGEFRNNYKRFTKYLTEPANSTSVRLELSRAIFTKQDQPLKPAFQTVAKSVYEADVIPINFENVDAATNSINTYIARATNNRITNIINTDDLSDAEILMVSTLYFKGQWKIPFNKTATRTETFFNEMGTSKGEVQMMYQTGPFPYSIIEGLKAHAVELPYGKGDRFSMVVVLPRKGEPISDMLRQLANIPFSKILDTLKNAQELYGDEDVQVYLPRFTIYSDYNMNVIMQALGIKDLFDYKTADLLGMFYHFLYVQRVVQQAKIEVNEEGSEASAADSAVFSYKTPPPKFYANRDFAYFIVDKSTKSIIFEGKVSNPRKLCNNCHSKNKA